MDLFFQDSLKKPEIKKEDGTGYEEKLSTSFASISFVKLFRPTPPRPKYVPSDNPTLLGKPVKNFKKFRKQVP